MVKYTGRDGGYVPTMSAVELNGLLILCMSVVNRALHLNRHWPIPSPSLYAVPTHCWHHVHCGADPCLQIDI
jgi:hypothetical protein